MSLPHSTGGAYRIAAAGFALILTARQAEEAIAGPASHPDVELQLDAERHRLYLEDVADRLADLLGDAVAYFDRAGALSSTDRRLAAWAREVNGEGNGHG